MLWVSDSLQSHTLSDTGVYPYSLSLSLPLLSCSAGYFGENCTDAACSKQDIIQNECQNQTCEMDAESVNGYKCIPTMCKTNNSCSKNETCAWDPSTGMIHCLSDPCSGCSKHRICDFHALYSNTSCPCKPGYDQNTDCTREKPCDNDTDPCLYHGICGSHDDNGISRCTCTDGEALCMHK